ncbi:hypothetical protein CU098_007578 [Rhizopus stolonifer]|uniref:Uncharacterized protein n=1 Tax=Rhizopus stolonifer TaxID=4846 RepID=A0A367KW49_RHIST|nr:hypothetical protein CU098_007578 [Rhizopus stolonifer]
MKFQVLFAVILALLCSTVVSLNLPYKDMSDQEIANLYVSKMNDASFSTENQIFYPRNNVTWYVGENVNVTFKKDTPSDQTVSIFFFNRSPLLAGGPLSTKVFPFDVPENALSPPGGTSLLLAVRRKNFYLQTVDSVVVRVLPRRNA